MKDLSEHGSGPEFYQEPMSKAGEATTAINSSPLTPEPLEDFLNRVNNPMGTITQELAPHVSLSYELHSGESATYLGSLPLNSELVAFNDSWDLMSLNSHDTTPILAKHSMQSLLRIFRTWPGMLAKGYQYPLIFHHSVRESEGPVPTPLANCCTLVKMWYHQHEGNSIVNEAIIKEMGIILNTVRSPIFYYIQVRCGLC